ncbi:MAG TPA: hypothetical protein VFE78_03095 [Gemmataceae bacterium]|jgi:hypothetical protein|nr:hypothetical protein [Gemmataceae bacterium]
MGSNQRRGPDRNPARTTADATLTLAAAVRALAAGPALDGRLTQALARLGQRLDAAGLSTTWEGAGRVVACVTKLGWYLETQVHAGDCLCRVAQVLRGNAVAKQLASAQAATLPEALAKAALLAALEAEPLA